MVQSSIIYVIILIVNKILLMQTVQKVEVSESTKNYGIELLKKTQILILKIVTLNMMTMMIQK